MTQRTPIRYCLIGYGAISAHHARILSDEGAIAAWVVGRVAEDTAVFASERGIPRHTTSLDYALAAGDFDAVVVTSPNALHYEHVRQSLLAGKHVLSELPLATSYGEAVELVDLADRRGLTLMVAHSGRFNPALVEARRRISEGELHVRHIVARGLMHRLTNIGWTGRRRSWTDSVIWHHGGHVVDCCLWMLGVTSPEEVTSRGLVAPTDPRTATPLNFGAVIRTSAGEIVSAAMSYTARFGGTEYLIIGDEDTLHYADGVLRGSTGVVMTVDGQDSGNQLAAWAAQDREFLSALREGRPPASSGRDVLPHLAVLQQVQDDLASADALASSRR